MEVKGFRVSQLYIVVGKYDLHVILMTFTTTQIFSFMGQYIGGVISKLNVHWRIQLDV